MNNQLQNFSNKSVKIVLDYSDFYMDAYVRELARPKSLASTACEGKCR